MARRVPIAQYQCAVLLGLYNFAIGQSDPFVLLDEIHEKIGCGNQLANICIEGLEKEGLVEIVNWTGRSAVRLTRNGFEAVDQLPDDQISRAQGLFNADKKEIEQQLYLGGGEIPASDRTVTLNHNQPDYKDAVAALDKAIEAFEQDDCLDNVLGPEKLIIRKSLDVARDYLQLNEINIRVGISLIVERLQYIAKKYENAIAGATLGQLFRIAADKIMSLLN